jgi:hypothetical protein
MSSPREEWCPMNIKTVCYREEVEMPEEEYYAEVHTVLDPIILDQKPFVHAGMTVGEFFEELEYYKNNWDKVLDHTYIPLWKQKT